jgi:type IV pilus assembly protein PilB
MKRYDPTKGKPRPRPGHSDGKATATPGSMKAVSSDTLGKLLLQRGHVTRDQLDLALAQQKDKEGYLGDILVEQEAIDQSILYSTLAEQAGLPFVNLEPAYQDPAVAGIIAFALIKKLRAIPLFKVEKNVTVAMDDPTDLNRIQELSFATGCRVNGVYTTAEAIDAAIEARTGNLIQVAGLQRSELKGADEDPTEAYGWHEEDASDPNRLGKLSAVVDLIDNLIVDALSMRASDIHLEPKARHLRVRFRIDGILNDRPSVPNGYKAAVISRCKIMSRMDIAERRIPQDGAFSVRFRGRRIDFRVSTFPTRYGEVLVIRILDRSGLKLDLDRLGFPGSLASDMRQVVKAPNGILLVTGPTGSGKTTTLYSLLKELDAARKKIITLEDPVEYDLDDVCQGQTHVKAGFTFAKGLRAILRQDPDIIMVGEVRDVETAQIAIQASLTGHLVMSTLHTNSAASAIARMLDMGLEPFLLATSLSGILAQRLVRKLCPNCKEPYELTVAEQETLGTEFPGEKRTQPLYRAGACMYCNELGYRGRTGIFEYLEVDQQVQSLIIRRISGRRLEREISDARAFRTLRDEGMDKVSAGETTLEEVLRVTNL